MRYAFYISGQSKRLRIFLRSAPKYKIDLIKLVISDYEICEELKDILKEKGIKYEYTSYVNLGDNNYERNMNFSVLMLNSLVANRVDYCFSFGSHILLGQLLNVYKNKLINFHPAILPMYPGVKAIDAAIKDNRSFLIGNTAHFIDEGIDTGRIIMQSCMPIRVYLEDGDYDCVLNHQIKMLDYLIDILEKNLLTVDEYGAYIKGADYTKCEIYPDCSMI